MVINPINYLVFQGPKDNSGCSWLIPFRSRDVGNIIFKLVYFMFFKISKFQNFKIRLLFILFSISGCAYCQTVWEGDESAIWTDGGNWTSGVPTYLVDAEIPNSVCNICQWPQITAGTKECKNLTFVAGGTQIKRLTFVSPGQLHIYGNFTNSSGQVDVMGDSTENVSYLVFKGTTDKTFTGTTLIKKMTIDKSSGKVVSVESGRPEIIERLYLQNGGGMYIKSSAGLKMRSKQGSSTTEAYTAYIQDDGINAISGPGAVNTFISQYIPPTPYNSENPDGYCYHFLGSPVNDPQFYRSVQNTINKYSTASWYNTGYHYPSGASPCFYLFDESEYDPSGSDEHYGWLGLDGGTPGTYFGQGEGIMAHFTPKRATRVIDWKGAPNSGDVTQQYRYTNNNESANDGKNLAGNPYPSPLNWAGVYSDNIGYGNLNSVITVWHTDGGISSTGDLLMFDADENADPELNTHSGILAIGQGFFLQVTENDATVEIFNWNRYYGTVDYPAHTVTPFRQRTTTKANNLGLVLEKDGRKVFTTFIANDKYSVGFDPLWDNGLVRTSEQEFVLYSRLQGHSLAANKFNLDKDIFAVDLVMEGKTPGVYTLKPYAHTFDLGEHKVYLRDKLQNQITEIMPNSSFPIEMKESTTGNRFDLVFAKANLSMDKIQNWKPVGYTLFQKGSTVCLGNEELIDEDVEFTISDISGRVIHSHIAQLKNGAFELKLPGSCSGILIARVQGSRGLVTAKIVCK